MLSFLYHCPTSREQQFACTCGNAIWSSYVLYNVVLHTCDYYFWISYWSYVTTTYIMLTMYCFLTLGILSGSRNAFDDLFTSMMVIMNHIFMDCLNIPTQTFDKKSKQELRTASINAFVVQFRRSFSSVIFVGGVTSGEGHVTRLNIDTSTN